MKTPEAIDYKKIIIDLEQEMSHLKNISTNLQLIKKLMASEKSLTEAERKQLAKYKEQSLKSLIEIDILELDKNIQTKDAYIENYKMLTYASIESDNKRISDLQANFDKDIRIAKELCNNGIIEKQYAGNRRVLKDLIKQSDFIKKQLVSVETADRFKLIEFQTKLDDQLKICGNILESFK